jgi:hypothetical protein
LDSDEAKTLSTDDYSTSSFWKGALPPYRETIDNEDNSIASPDSFHSIEDDGERDINQSTQDDNLNHQGNQCAQSNTKFNARLNDHFVFFIR